MSRISFFSLLSAGLVCLYLGYTGPFSQDWLCLLGSSGMFMIYVTVSAWVHWELRSHPRASEIASVVIGVLTAIAYIPLSASLMETLEPHRHQSGDIPINRFIQAYLEIPVVISGILIALGIRGLSKHPKPNPTPAANGAARRG